MQTFTQSITSTAWTEVLRGNGYLAFDCHHSSPVWIYLSKIETAPAITEEGNVVRTWPENWDFQAANMIAGTQQIYVRGDNIITGVRG